MLARCVKLWSWGSRKVLRSALTSIFSPFYFVYLRDRLRRKGGTWFIDWFIFLSYPLKLNGLIAPNCDAIFWGWFVFSDWWVEYFTIWVMFHLLQEENMKTVLMNPNIASVQTNAEGEKQVQNCLLSVSWPTTVIYYLPFEVHYGNVVVLQ